ncbi:MAG: hypothetical protein OEY11_15450 [Gammaproteobacteria bacterium]|nr:hypothetical protein [Gammaproteobacteria bacterium]
MKNISIKTVISNQSMDNKDCHTQPMARQLPPVVVSPELASSMSGWRAHWQWLAALNAICWKELPTCS